MTKKLFSIFWILGFALLAMPAHTYAVCSIQNGVTFCDNSGDDPDAFITPVSAPGNGVSITPGLSSSGFNPRGVFGCGNISGSMSQSVGTMSAMGGAFVPVNDAAVTLNSGSLIYKECILRGLVDRARELSIANTVKNTTNTFLTGRDGSPMFSENLRRDMLSRADTVVNVGLDITSGRLNTLNPAFKEDVRIAIGRNYYALTDGSNQDLQCPYTGDVNALINGQFSWEGLGALRNPVCNPLGAYQIAQAKIMGDVVADQNDMTTRLNWNNGVYDVVDPNTGNVVTPGFIIAGTIQQQLGAGFNMQQNANDINQMLVSFLADTGNQIIQAALGGLQGLVRNVGGQPAFLQTVVNDSAAGLRDSAANAGLQILLAARQVELSFLNAKQATGAVLAGSISQLRGTENQCWDLIVPKAKEYALHGNCTGTPGNLTCSGPFGIRVATSTTFSQPVIALNITGLAKTISTEIATSTATFNSINQMIAQVSYAASPSVQQTALQQLDEMVVRGTLHNQYESQAAEKQTRDTAASMGTLVANTVKHWGDDALSATDPSSGWCNVNSPDVIKMWANKWKI